MKTIKAQLLYNLRDMTAWISGTDLHELFTELVGEPSPSGYVDIDYDKLPNDTLAELCTMPWNEIQAYTPGFNWELSYEDWLKLPE